MTGSDRNSARSAGASSGTGGGPEPDSQRSRRQNCGIARCPTRCRLPQGASAGTAGDRHYLRTRLRNRWVPAPPSELRGGRRRAVPLPVGDTCGGRLNLDKRTDADRRAAWNFRHDAASVRCLSTPEDGVCRQRPVGLESWNEQGAGRDRAMVAPDPQVGESVRRGRQSSGVADRWLRRSNKLARAAERLTALDLRQRPAVEITRTAAEPWHADNSSRSRARWPVRRRTTDRRAQGRRRLITALGVRAADDERGGAVYDSAEHLLHLGGRDVGARGADHRAAAENGKAIGIRHAETDRRCGTSRPRRALLATAAVVVLHEGRRGCTIRPEQLVSNRCGLPVGAAAGFRLISVVPDNRTATPGLGHAEHIVPPVRDHADPGCHRHDQLRDFRAASTTRSRRPVEVPESGPRSRRRNRW